MSEVIDVIDNKDMTETPEEIIAKLPKEKLKTLFYLFSGKPDSRVKVYSDPIFIDRNDIIELNDCVTRKLNTHSVDAQITTVNVSYIGNDIQEFGTWAEFGTHHWQEPEEVEEVVIKWDFMVKIDAYQIPQRHTLLVRISSDIKPGKMLQMMVSGNSDDFDQMDILSAPAFCRVDFINTQISKELINVVTEWYKGRREPTLIPDFYYWFKQRKHNVASLLHHLLPLSYSLLWVSGFLWAVKNKYAFDLPIHIAAIWVFFGLYLISPIAKIGHTLASRVYRELSELEGSKVVFDFTSGDKKKNAEIQNDNKLQGRKFLKESSWSLLLNIIAGGVTAYLFSNS